MEFSQRYQEIAANARLDGLAAQVWEASLQADRVRFVIVDAPDTANEASLYFEGAIRGNAMAGSVERGVGAARSVEHFRIERR